MAYKAKDFSVEEKIKLLAGKDNWHTEDLGGKLYEVTVSDGPLGVRKPAQDEKGNWQDLPSVAYPSSEVLSQTWNPELAYKTGEMLADDCIEKGVDVLLAPGVNVKRDPLCGRNFEYYSEDPYLAGVFGREYVKGLQAHHVGATLKHFCCNNIEYNRDWQSSEVDERPLREIYLRPFEIVCEAKPQAVMCSYNLVNGVRMSEHKKLYAVLREEFGFDGLIMSDWGAVKDHTASVKAGLDLEMPYSDQGKANLETACKEGRLTEAETDVCAQRVLDFIADCEKESKKRKVETTREQRLAAARKVAAEGIVLLKNEGALPLKKGANVSVSGWAAVEYISGAGSSRVRLQGDAPKLVDCLKASMPDGEFVYRDGDRGWGAPAQGAVAAACGKDAAIICVGAFDSEGCDRTARLPWEEELLIKETAKRNENTVVVLYCGACVDMTEWEDSVSAIVWAGYPGEEGQYAVADILTGKVNPSGKLTETFYRYLEDAPSASAYRTPAVSRYSEGLLVGYRWCDMQTADGGASDARFPFGHGLSYTRFEYSSLSVKKKGDGAEVSFDVADVGDRDGAEVAQVYVREINPAVFRPYKELKGFKKVFLKAGEKKRATVTLTRDDFAFWSTALDCRTVTPGLFEIIVAASSEDIRLRATLQID